MPWQRSQQQRQPQGDTGPTLEDLIAEEERRQLASAGPVTDRAKYAALMNARYDTLDRKLVAKGFPPTSPWWREQVRRFFEFGGRQVVFRVGRRGGKSSTLSRVGVVEALYGQHNVPPGDTGFVAIVAQNKKEASRRLKTIIEILNAINVRHRPIADGVEIEGTRRAFCVYAASIAGVSGFTSICIICDEVAKWRDADTGANPAKEVISSIRPTYATMPLAKIVLLSSPMGTLDSHAAAYDEGNSEFQIIAHAPTWIANPTITEEATKKEEPNPDIWRREFAAVPIEGTEQSVFSGTLIDVSMRENSDDLPREPGVEYVAAMDPAMSRNSWTLCIAARRNVKGKIKRSVVAMRQWTGTPTEPLNPIRVMKDIAMTCRKYGVEQLVSDQHHGASLQAIGQLPEVDIYVRIEPATGPSNTRKYEDLLTWMNNREVDLPKDDQIKADLLGVRRVVTANGISIRLDEDGERHSDYAPSIALALAWCRIDPDNMGPEPGTPEHDQEQNDAIWRDMERKLETKAQQEWWEQ